MNAQESLAHGQEETSLQADVVDSRVQEVVVQEGTVPPTLEHPIAAQDSVQPVESASTVLAATESLRALPSTLTAAHDAATFVAHIFAESKAEKFLVVDSPIALPEPRRVDFKETSVGGQTDTTVQLLLGQRILILGLGASGLAMARWCVRAGAASVTVADTRNAPPQLTVLQHELPQVRFVAGAFTAALVDGQSLNAVYRSPGLSPEVVNPVSLAASANGISVDGELSLYAMALQCMRTSCGYSPTVLAITGTNGKTTVTSLAGQLMARAGKSVAVAGNIGPTLLDTLTAHLDANNLPEAWVLELSSFQLDCVTGFEPTAAVVLNVTQDHLDWHGSMQAYAQAKSRIFGATGVMVLNRDDAMVMAMLSVAGPTQGVRPALGSSIFREATSVVANHFHRVKLKHPQERTHLTFGTDMPQRPGDFGIEEVNGMVWLVRALEADETRRKKREAAPELHFQRLMPADALRIRGRHNASNALAALALCAAAGCTLAPVLFGLREFRGEPHRVESIGILNGVEFFDDSKGTNVGATVAALQGLGADRKLVVILGGEGKGQDFSPLAAPIARYARAVVLIGRDAPLIRQAIGRSAVPMVDADSMEMAVVQANQRAHAGDVILMSPACASFDMFNNYEHRAQAFCAAVKELALNTGFDLGGLA